MAGLEMDVARGDTPFGKKLIGSYEDFQAATPSDLRIRVVLRQFSNPKSAWRGLESWSGGQRELLMVLTAVLLSGATNVFLDEPGHSLHPPKQAQLRRWLETRQKSGQVLLAVTHSTEMISPTWLGCLYHMHHETQGYGASCVREIHETKVDKKARKTRKKSGPGEEESDSTGKMLETSESDDNTIPNDQSETEGSPSKKPRLSEAKPKLETKLSSTIIEFLMGVEMRRLFFSSGVVFVEGDSDRRVIQALKSVTLRRANALLEDNSSSIKDWYEAHKETQMDSWDVIPVQGCGDWLKAYSSAESLGIPFLILLDGDVLNEKRGSVDVAMRFETWLKSRVRRNVCNSDIDTDHPLKKVVQTIDKLTNDVETQGCRGSLVRNKLKERHLWVLKGNLEDQFFKNDRVREKFLQNRNFQQTMEDLQVRSPLQQRPNPSLTTLSSCCDNFQKSFDSLKEEFLELVSGPGHANRVSVFADRLINNANEVERKLRNYVKSIERPTKEDSSENREQYWFEVGKKLHGKGWKRVSFELLEEMVKILIEQDDEDWLEEESASLTGLPRDSPTEQENYNRFGLHALWEHIKNQQISDDTEAAIPPDVCERKMKSLLKRGK